MQKKYEFTGEVKVFYGNAKDFYRHFKHTLISPMEYHAKKGEK